MNTPYALLGKTAGLYDTFLSLGGYQRSVEYFVAQLPFAKDGPWRVLDAGCGTGLYSLTILKQYRHARVTAFDLNATLVERVQYKLTKNQLDARAGVFAADIKSDLHELGNETFDLILAAGVLEYVPLEKTIRHLSRFLRPGGYFANSPVRKTAYGNLICTLYACTPRPRSEYLGAFAHHGFMLEKIVELPWYSLSSFKELQVFKKSPNG